MNFKYAKILAVALLSVSMVACDDGDNEDYSPAPKVNGFYFAEQPSEYLDLTRESNTFSFTVSRNNTEGAKTAELTVNADPVFSIPTTVNFAQGESTVTVPVTFNGEDLDLQDYYINISVPEDEAFPYGVSNLALTVGLKDDLRWATIGTGWYRDAFLDTFFNLNLTAWEVEIQEHATNKGVYRILEAYYPYGGTGNLVVNCADPEGVYIEQQSLGLDVGYGDVVAFSQAARYLNAGNSLAAIKATGKYCGTLKDGCVTFPNKALLVSMADYNNAGLYYGNTKDAFLLMLPDAYEASKNETPAE